MPPILKKTPIQHVAFTVLNTSSEAVAENAEREYLLLVNDSDTAIYLAFGTAATVNSGVRLNANGGSFEMSRLLGNLTQAQVNAISSVTSKKLCGVEF